MTVKILIINGVGTAGKDSFVDAMKRNFNPLRPLTTISMVKEISKEMGCDPTIKDDRNRKFLSDLKDLWTGYNDGIFHKLTQEIDEAVGNLHIDGHCGIITIMCREPEEIDKFVDYYGTRMCKTVLIDRPVEHIPDNHADIEVWNYEYDHVIDNNGTLADLENKAKKFIEELF